MKKFFTMAALFAAGLLGFSSCSNEDGMFNEPTQALKPGEVAFSTGQLASKSGVTTTSLTDIYVKATTSTDEVFFDVEKFSYDGSVFRSVTNHYWPNNTADGANNTLNFYASNQQEALTAGTQANPSPIVDDYECNGIKDWVTATVKAGEKTIPYPLTFQHVLSQIKITAEAKDKTQDLVYKVVGVKLSAPNTGDYQFANATAGVGTWTIDNSSSGNYTYEQNMNGTFNPTAATEADQTWASTDYFNILPVTSGTLTFDVQYQVIQNGQVIGDFTGANSKQVTVDAPNLLSGKIYTYNFVLAVNTSDVITFTLTTTNWGAGNTKNVAVPGPFYCIITLTDGTVENIKKSSSLLKAIKAVAPITDIQKIEIGTLCDFKFTSFRDFPALTSIIYPRIPTEPFVLGTGDVFLNCTSLTSALLPNNIRTIPSSCFKNCSSLTTFTIPNSVSEIRNEAFRGCTSLTSLTIPNSVISIGEYAFYGCSMLSKIDFEGTISEWNSISKNSDWNYLSSITVIHCTDGDIEI